MTDPNPVGTKAKRDRRHRLLGGREIRGESLCTDCYDRTWPCDARKAFDGLDIAEEIVRAEQVVEWVVGREAYVLLDRDFKWWRYWRIAADKARWGALAEWDKWKGGK